MIDPLSFAAPTALQPLPAQGSGTIASALDNQTNPSSTTTRSTASAATGVGPTRVALVANDHGHAGTASVVKAQGDTIVLRLPQAHADLRDAASKFGSANVAATSSAVAYGAASGIAAKTESAAKQNSWLDSASGFAKGVGEGAWDGTAGMVEGVGGLAKGAYHLATSADARSQAADTLSKGATAASHFAKTAVTDPAKAASQVGHAVTGAVDGVSTAYHQAAANGHGAEFIGKAFGQGAILAATLPVGGAEAEGAAVVGDLGRIAEATGDLGKASDALGDAGRALHSTETASSSVTAHATGELQTAAQPTFELDATSKALSSGQKLSQGEPPVDLQHVYSGEIGLKRGKDAAKGFHHAPADGLHPNARVTDVIEPRDTHGVYLAKVEVSNPEKTAAYTKKSTMFPDSMSRDDVLQSIQHAYDNATEKSGDRFRGPSGHGFDVVGYTSGAGADLHIRTAYPKIDEQ